VKGGVVRELRMLLGASKSGRAGMRWRQGRAWAQRGLVLAWKGEVVHPRCTREPVRLQDPVLPGPVGALFTLRNT
jgi:hypothetical protein